MSARSLGALLCLAVVGCDCGGGDTPPPGMDASIAPDATRPIPDATQPTPDAPPPTPDAPPRLGPPYPVVLAHGFFGFDDFAGAGFLDYFYGVREHLESEGETLVFVTEVDPFNSSTVRGGELADQIDDILAMTGHAKVVIVGHSQGGLDARVVAHDRPDLVAAVLTIATPHGGSPISDVVLGLIADDRARSLVDELGRVIGAPLYDAAGEETSVVAALEQFSSDGIAAFDDAYPDAPGVDYYSLTGVTALRWDDTCEPASAPAFVARWSEERDGTDPLLGVSEAILASDLLDPIPNDGLVTVEGARHGTFLGCIPADHLDEVGQLLGDRASLLNDFDHLAFYTELVEWLRAQGY